MGLSRPGARRSARVAMAAALVAAMLATAGCVGGLRRAADDGATGMSAPGAAPTPEAVSPSPGYAPNYSEAQSDGARSSVDVASEAPVGVELQGGASKGVGAVPIDPDQLVIRTKSMLVRVKDVDGAVKDVRRLVAKHGGSVEALQLSDDDTPVYYEAAQDGRPLGGYVTVRIPVASFERFVADAAKLGRVLRQSENSADVTQQHVDMKARLDNLRAEEARLREMFDAAKNVSEMLDVERELSRVRGEAESLQAQIDSLERQAALSTITIELQGPEPIVEPSGVDWGVAAAFREGVRAFVASLNAMIVLVMGSSLWIATLAVMVLAVWALVRRTRRRRPSAQEPEPDE